MMPAANAVNSDLGRLKVFLAELIYSVLLASSVLHTTATQSGNQFYGFTISMSVFAGATAVGSISGGAFNPAVAWSMQFGQCALLSYGRSGFCDPLAHFYLYWIAGLLGGVIAGLGFILLSPPRGDEYLQVLDE